MLECSAHPLRRPRPFGARARIGVLLRGSAFAVAVAGAYGLAGCGDGRNANAPSSSAVSAYSGRQATLFDDSIEPAAVGLDFDKGYSPRADSALRERAQVGDAVLRVRVSTVTAKTDGPAVVYQLGLHTVAKIGGKSPPPADFTVEITKASESHGIMKNFESRLVGYAFVAFVRQFAQPTGERELHFHLAPDTKDVQGAVDEAMVMGELK